MSDGGGMTDGPAEASSDSAPASLRGRRRFLAALIVFSAATLLAVIGVEIGFRLFVAVTDIPFYFTDPVLGPRRAPNQTGRWIRGSHINARYEFNAQGWNHPEDFVVVKPPGTRRICIVGDSYVEALQVNPEETMFAVAQRRMNRPDRPVQWYAFGCSGWGTTQQYEAIRHYVLDYHPDVVVMFFVGNDPFDSSPYVARIERCAVTYCLDPQGNLSLLTPSFWKPRWSRRLAARLSVVRYFMVQKGLLERGRPRAGLPNQMPLREESLSGDYHHVEGLSEMSADQRKRKTWELIEKTLEAARDECRRRGAVLVLVYRGCNKEIEASLTQVRYTPPPRDVDPYCLGQRISEMAREFVGPIAKRLGIPYLDLTDALAAMVSKTGKSHRFPKDGHYNPLAHQTVGQALADWLDPMLQDTEYRLRPIHDTKGAQ